MSLVHGSSTGTRIHYRSEVKAIRINKYETLGTLLLLTAGALLVMGYHPCAEDAEIYMPGVQKILHPELFPMGREFFLSHARLTFFPNLIALSLRVTHLPFDWGVFLWQVLSIFLLLAACWELSGLLFPTARARWAGVCLVAALLTIPVAGTALYIVDQYLNPRNLAAFAAVFAVVRTLEKKYLRSFLWIAFTACLHPLMWVFPFALCLLLAGIEKFEDRLQSGVTEKTVGAIAALLVFPGIPLAPVPSRAYQEVAKLHGYFYIQRWAWYEWLGAVAPLFLFWWFGRLARRREAACRERVCWAFVIYGAMFLSASLVVDLPVRFEVLARLQPMRSLHLMYIVMFLVMGGFVGECVLQQHVWRWLLLFVPLSLGMFYAQRALFPASAHLGLPGTTPKNPWAQAFLWIRENTPVNALFALDPQYSHIEGEDEVGFRCAALRSRLADWDKDNGAVSMFPQLGEEWWSQVQAQRGWKSFQLEDFLRLKNQYGVGWVVLQRPGVGGMDCPYSNAAVQVCKLP